MSRTLQVPHNSEFRDMTDAQLDDWHMDLTERAAELEDRIRLKREVGEDTAGVSIVLRHTNRGLRTIAEIRRVRAGDPPPLEKPKPVHDFVSACMSVKAMLRLLSFYEAEHRALTALMEADDDTTAEEAAWDALEASWECVEAAYRAGFETLAREVS